MPFWGGMRPFNMPSICEGHPLHFFITSLSYGHSGDPLPSDKNSVFGSNIFSQLPLCGLNQHPSLPSKTPVPPKKEKKNRGEKKRLQIEWKIWKFDRGQTSRNSQPPLPLLVQALGASRCGHFVGRNFSTRESSQCDHFKIEWVSRTRPRGPKNSSRGHLLPRRSKRTPRFQ